ncbi:hypothetical protein PPERSA_06183 [Pseudocohnilembus persalinus]|uniref:Uncharacterized protein n=1 Tax=Pseudocohnilembus persalinus TaxID=266149 RepID=A0A0V0R1G5_PSEPJ|nr:hypothetical protein PPERSA_06183 [Pseudocohnilembus persalinus]|eukprot:KRX08005.1 hypothetical protein PPERSA_06183 [Pseudocohnilembus persalinus]
MNVFQTNQERLNLIDNGLVSTNLAKQHQKNMNPKNYIQLNQNNPFTNLVNPQQESYQNSNIHSNQQHGQNQSFYTKQYQNKINHDQVCKKQIPFQEQVLDFGENTNNQQKQFKNKNKYQYQSQNFDKNKNLESNVQNINDEQNNFEDVYSNDTDQIQQKDENLDIQFDFQKVLDPNIKFNMKNQNKILQKQQINQSAQQKQSDERGLEDIVQKNQVIDIQQNKKINNLFLDGIQNNIKKEEANLEQNIKDDEKDEHDNKDESQIQDKKNTIQRKLRNTQQKQILLKNNQKINEIEYKDEKKHQINQFQKIDQDDIIKEMREDFKKQQQQNTEKLKQQILSADKISNDVNQFTQIKQKIYVPLKDELEKPMSHFLKARNIFISYLQEQCAFKNAEKIEEQQETINDFIPSWKQPKNDHIYDDNQNIQSIGLPVEDKEIDMESRKNQQFYQPKIVSQFNEKNNFNLQQENQNLKKMVVDLQQNVEFFKKQNQTLALENQKLHKKIKNYENQQLIFNQTNTIATNEQFLTAHTLNTCGDNQTMEQYLLQKPYQQQNYLQTCQNDELQKNIFTQEDQCDQNVMIQKNFQTQQNYPMINNNIAVSPQNQYDKQINFFKKTINQTSQKKLIFQNSNKNQLNLQFQQQQQLLDDRYKSNTQSLISIDKENHQFNMESHRIIQNNLIQQNQEKNKNQELNHQYNQVQTNGKQQNNENKKIAQLEKVQEQKFKNNDIKNNNAQNYMSQKNSVDLNNLKQKNELQKLLSCREINSDINTNFVRNKSTKIFQYQEHKNQGHQKTKSGIQKRQIFLNDIDIGDKNAHIGPNINQRKNSNKYTILSNKSSNNIFHIEQDLKDHQLQKVSPQSNKINQNDLKLNGNKKKEIFSQHNIQVAYQKQKQQHINNIYQSQCNYCVTEINQPKSPQEKIKNFNNQFQQQNIFKMNTVPDMIEQLSPISQKYEKNSMIQSQQKQFQQGEQTLKNNYQNDTLQKSKNQIDQDNLKQETNTAKDFNQKSYLKQKYDKNNIYNNAENQFKLKIENNNDMIQKKIKNNNNNSNSVMRFDQSSILSEIFNETILQQLVFDVQQWIKDNLIEQSLNLEHFEDNIEVDANKTHQLFVQQFRQTQMFNMFLQEENIKYH